MIDKTNALVLRIAPFSRTSHIVTWLTSDYGKLATIVKGARRPKSAFLGQYDLFYTCELLFYTRERNGLHIIRECSPFKTRSSFRKNWQAAFLASYVCDLVSRVSPEGHNQPELYRLADQSLDFLCHRAATFQFMLWFELKFMEILGFAPQFSKCLICHIDLSAPDSGSPLFSYVGGGFLCANCARKRHLESHHISADLVAMLRSWQNAKTPRRAQNTKCNHKHIIELKQLLGMFLNYHLDFLPSSRRIVSGMLS
ncbi:DNA repair protein RecO [Verrucomicrobiota bacterium]